MLTSPGHPFEFDGKEYFLGRVTQGDKETFHAYTNATAIKLVHEMAKFQSEEEAARAYADAMKRVTTGYYWWDEEGGLACRRTWAGFLRIFWITLKVKTERGKFIQPPFEDVLAIAEVNEGKWLVEQSALANANPIPPQRKESTDGEGSTPNSPSAGESPSNAAAA